jgi:cytochrome c6
MIMVTPFAPRTATHVAVPIPRTLLAIAGIARVAMRYFPAIGIAVCIALSFVGSQAHAADTIKGKRVYDMHCAVCHGPNGRASLPGAPDLNRPEAMMRPDMTLLASIRSGKNVMPAFQGLLSDRDIMDVIAYVRTLH